MRVFWLAEWLEPGEKFRPVAGECLQREATEAASEAVVAALASAVGSTAARRQAELEVDVAACQFEVVGLVGSLC